MPSTRSGARAAGRGPPPAARAKRRRVAAPAAPGLDGLDGRDGGEEEPRHGEETPRRKRSKLAPARKGGARAGDEEQRDAAAQPRAKAGQKTAAISAEEAGIVGRQAQIAAVREFLAKHLEEKRGGSLYVCGTTGTGKTACVQYVLRSELARGARSAVKVAKLNGNTLERPGHIYGALLRSLGHECSVSAATTTTRASLEKIFRPAAGRPCKGPLHVVLLDEIDQLITANKTPNMRQEVLYQLFRWANLPRSRLILIGIANAVNLHDRFLPELLREGYSSEMLVFPAYNKEELKSILEAQTARLARETSVGTVRFDPIAIELCARKVAAKSGDLRKGLDICKRALLDAATAANASSESKKSESETSAEPPTIVVGAATVLRVMRSAFESSHVKTIKELPLQVQYALCAIVRQQRATQRDGKRTLLVGDIFRAYTAMAREWTLPAQPFAGFCDTLLGRLLEDGLVALAGNPKKELRQRSLKVDVLESDAVFALEQNIATQALVSGKSRRHNGGVNLYARGPM